MKTLNSLFRQGKWIACTAAMLSGVLILAMCINIVRADPPFGLTVQVTNSTQLALTITNAVNTTAYEVQRRLTLDPINPWVHETNGTPGQTNFTVDMGIYTLGFFRALPCLDCDSDGIDNWMDADPYNAAVGILTITIDSPTNGMTFN